MTLTSFWRSRVLPVLLPLIFVSGCSASDRLIEIQPVPALDPALASRCPDPGVAADAVRALIETRQAWAECAARHSAVVASWPARQDR